MKTNYSVIKSIAIAGIIGLSTQAFSQEIIDKVEAVVGNKIILHSDVENNMYSILHKAGRKRRISVVQFLISCYYKN